MILLFKKLSLMSMNAIILCSHKFFMTSSKLSFKDFLLLNWIDLRRGLLNAVVFLPSLFLMHTLHVHTIGIRNIIFI